MKNIPNFSKAGMLLLFLVLTGSLASAAPNILIILADDAGYADFGFQSGGIDHDFADLTPNIDSIAHTGITFSNAHVSAPVCSPSRAGLLTGRYQQRFGMEENADPAYTGLPASEVTMANTLKALNYRTYAIGKWHLGADLAEMHPNQRGFDEFFGFLSGERTYFRYNGTSARTQLQRNGAYVSEQPGEYLTDLFGNEAAGYLDAHAANFPTQPFFMYLAFNAVHVPLQATQAALADPRIQDIAVPERKTLAAMTISMDNAVGLVLARLQERGLADNTIVVFLSDNGGPETGVANAPNWSDNGPLRGYKTLIYEGGIRVPMAIKWPAGIAPALVNTTLADPVSSLDLLPTFVAAANGTLLPAQQIDGINFLARLNGQSPTPLQRSLFWRTKGSTGTQRAALIGSSKFDRSADVSSDQLFNLDTDLGETADLAAVNPAGLADAQTSFADWEGGMVEPLWGTGTPTISNPNLVRRSTLLGYELEKTGADYSYMVHDLRDPLSLSSNWEVEWKMQSKPVAGYQRNGSIVLSDTADTGHFIRVGVDFGSNVASITELQNNSTNSGSLQIPIPEGQVREFRLSYVAASRMLTFRSGASTVSHVLTANYKSQLRYSGFGLNASTLTQFSPIVRYVTPLAPAASPAWSVMKEKRDYAPGSYDLNGQFLGGTELMSIVAHQGQLFAGVGYKNDLFFGVGSTDPYPGPQILLKAAYNKRWQQDFALGANYERIECLRSLTITTDKFGAVLSPPVTLLLAGSGEIPPIPQTPRAVIFIRNNLTGGWTATYPDSTTSGSAAVRTIFSHLDAVTGIHYIFAGYGTNNATVVRGGYNAATGMIDWEAAPELTGSGTIQTAGECNGVLYACIDSDGITGNNNGGIFWRQDGLVPQWNFVHEFPLVAGTDPAMHGFTAVPHPRGFDYDVALVTLESSGKIYALDPIGGDPRNGHLVTENLDLNKFLGDVLQKGERVSYPVVSAYNDMPEVLDPATLQLENLIGLGIQAPPELNNSLTKSSSLLTRHHNSTYEIGKVFDPAFAVKLKAVRALCLSPFPEDHGQVLYLGGYDSALPGTPIWHNTAWLYRATFSGKLTP